MNQYLSSKGHTLVCVTFTKFSSKKNSEETLPEQQKSQNLSYDLYTLYDFGLTFSVIILYRIFSSSVSHGALFCQNIETSLLRWINDWMNWTHGSCCALLWIRQMCDCFVLLPATCFCSLSRPGELPQALLYKHLDNTCNKKRIIFTAPLHIKSTSISMFF